MFKVGVRRLLALPLAEMPGPKSPADFGGFGPHRAREMSKHFHRTYGDTVNEAFSGRNQVLVFHPSDIEQVFRKEGPTPIGATAGLFMFRYYFEKYQLPGAIGDAFGEDWKRLRHSLQKHFFGPKDAANYIKLVTPAVSSAVQVAPQYADSMDQFFSLCTYDMMMSVLFGSPLNLASVGDKADPKDIEFVANARNTFVAMMRLFSEPDQIAKFHGKPESSDAYMEFEKAFSGCVARGREHVAAFMAKLDSAPADSPLRDTYVAKKLADGDLDEASIVSNVLGFLFAGVDTTSNTLQWMLYQLANSPKVQNTLREEFRTLLNGADLNKEAWSKMSYMRKVIKETNRLSPAADGTMRMLTENIELNGYDIPAGTTIRMTPTPYLTDPKVWGDDALQFVPERWDRRAKERPSSEMGVKVVDSSLQTHPYMVITFSKGPRMCLGARVSEIEMGTLLARLLQDYEVSLEPGTPEPEADTTSALSRPSPAPKYIFKPLSKTTN